MSDGDNAKFNIKAQDLSIRTGDTLAFYLPPTFSFEYTKALAEQLRKNLPENTTILLLKDGVRIETLPEQLMNNMGWYRLEKEEDVETIYE